MILALDSLYLSRNEFSRLPGLPFVTEVPNHLRLVFRHSA